MMRRIWNWWTRFIGIYCEHGWHKDQNCPDCDSPCGHVGRRLGLK